MVSVEAGRREILVTGWSEWKRRDQVALIADLDGSFALLMPGLPEEAVPSEAVQLLVTVAMRSDDPLWVEEMIESLHEKKQFG